jgi:hypothetical protein
MPCEFGEAEGALTWELSAFSASAFLRAREAQQLDTRPA